MADPSKSRACELAFDVFRAGLDAVCAEEATAKAVASPDFEKPSFWIVGAGKASARMARGARRALSERALGGCVVTKGGHGDTVIGVRVLEAAHPVPDESCVRAAQAIRESLADAPASAEILFLLSGGASALLEDPAPGLSLEDISKATEVLLAGGVEIDGVNAVRKHLSSVKGGQFLRWCGGRPVHTLAICDVVSGRPSSVGSGPTVADDTTFADALGVVNRVGAGRFPGAVVRYLEEGAAGGHPETTKADDPLLAQSTWRVVADNHTAIRACLSRAQELGYPASCWNDTVTGEAREVGRALAQAIRDTKGPACLVGGGETTVTLTGAGKGGRNQELALAAVEALAGAPGVALLSAGTDGTDGPTDAAGAFVTGDTLHAARVRGRDPAAYLADNNAYAFFDEVGGLLRTGPTGTNVMDLQIAIIG